MVEVAGDRQVATPPPAVPTDGHPNNLSDNLHATLGLRPGGSGLNTGTFKLTGLDSLTPATPPPVDKTKLPTLTISTPDHNPGAAPAKDSSATEAPDTEGKTSKIAREAIVLGGGLARSTLYGMASLPERVPELGASVAIGATLSSIARSGEFGAAATLFVGTYFTSKFIVNAINDTGRWQKFSEAVTDAWHSDKNTMKDLRDVSDTGGNFAFDAGLSYAAGYVGYKNPELANVILGGLKLPLPVPGIPAKMPLPPAMMNAGMYLSIVPPPLLYRHHYDDYDANHKTTDK